MSSLSTFLKLAHWASVFSVGMRYFFNGWAYLTSIGDPELQA